MADIEYHLLQDKVIVKFIELADGSHALRFSVGAVDDTSDALITSSIPRNQLHDGHTFSATHVDDSVNNDNNIDILIQTGNLVNHTLIGIAVGGDAEIECYEGTTFSDEGTTIDIINMNRTSSITSLNTITHAPAIDDIGSQMFHRALPGGSGGLSPGILERPDTEWMLKTNTVYLFRMTNKAGNKQTIGVAVQWHEPQ